MNEDLSQPQLPAIASGIIAGSDSNLESNNLTYSESGFNPTGSLRYTMLGVSSNLQGSVYNGLQSGSTGGVAVAQKGTMSSGGGSM